MDFALLLPVALEHVDNGLCVLVHESRSPVGVLSIDGILRMLLQGYAHIILMLLLAGNIFVLAEGVHKSSGLSVNIIIVVVGTAKSVLN